MIPFGSGSRHSINPILNHCGGRYRQSGAPVTLFPLGRCLKKGLHPGRKKRFFFFWAVNTWLLSSLRFYLRLNISTFTCLSVCQPAPTLLSSIPVRLTASRLQISSITHRLQYSTTRLARCRPKVHLHERVILMMTHKEELFFFRRVHVPTVVPISAAAHYRSQFISPISAKSPPTPPLTTRQLLLFSLQK